MKGVSKLVPLCSDHLDSAVLELTIRVNVDFDFSLKENSKPASEFKMIYHFATVLSFNHWHSKHA